MPLLLLFEKERRKGGEKKKVSLFFPLSSLSHSLSQALLSPWKGVPNKTKTKNSRDNGPPRGPHLPPRRSEALAEEVVPEHPVRLRLPHPEPAPARSSAAVSRRRVTRDLSSRAGHADPLTLPNARFLVLWSPEGGGIRAQRVEGDYTFTDKNPTQLLTAPATAGRAVVSDAIMGLTWTTPTDGAFIRVFNINPTGISSSVQEMAIGTTTANAPMPGAGIFGVGAPGFLAFALDGMPANNLKMLRVDFSNTPVTAETPVETGLGAIHVQAGEDPQVLVLQQQADSTSANPLRLRKFTKTVSTDEVVQLSQVVNLGAKSSVPSCSIAHTGAPEASATVNAPV